MSSQKSLIFTPYFHLDFMFYNAGIILSFFLCLLLLGKKNKNAADYLLAFWLGWIGLHLLLYYLFISQKVYEYPSLLGLNIPMPLVYPPLLYLYTATLSRGGLPVRWWWHFLPVLGCYLYLIPFVLLPAGEKIRVFQHEGEGYESFMLLINMAINLSGVVYTLLAWRLLRKHQRVISDLFSNQEKINLHWLRNLIFGIAGIWLAVLFGNDTIVFGGAVLFVLFIGYFGIRQGGIFTHQPAIELAQASYDEPDFPVSQESNAGRVSTPAGVKDTTPEKKKYEKSGLTPEAAESLHQQLQDLMSGQQLYKDSELSLTDLAERLDTHPNYLSQIINEKEGKNFYDYVNAMRVEAFLKMAAQEESQRFTLLALALECGFNSKSTFNRYFKKATGQSPSEVKRQQAS